MSPTPRYYRVDLDFWHKNTCHRLLKKFGPWGPCVWLSLVAEAKRSSQPGTISVTSAEALQDALGFIEYELPFTIDEFLAFTGELKQTSRTRDRRGAGHLQNVVLSHYKTWQQDWVKAGDRDRQNRRRSHQSARDTNSDTPRDTDRDRDLGLDLELKDLDLGSPTTQDQATAPTANGTSPATRKAEALIRNAGHELTAYSLDDELSRLNVPHTDRPRLRALGEKARAVATAHVRPINASDNEED